MPPTTPKRTDPGEFNLSVDTLLSLATAPFLLGLLGMQTATNWLQAAGIASEEVFRGDRLPILTVLDSPDRESVDPD